MVLNKCLKMFLLVFQKFLKVEPHPFCIGPSIIRMIFR